jgi:thiamine biosynthesis lipoprotein
MGCEVVVQGAADAAPIRALFAEYEGTFSRFLLNSELNRLNDAGGGRMSPLFADVLDVAIWASSQTGGLVDPGVGAAVAAAGYDADFASGLDRDEPAGAPVPAGSFRRVGRVLLLERGARLDLNGVVKSLAVDHAAALLDGEGFVAAGGDVATRGAVDVGLTGTAVRVRGGIATSGTTRRRWLRGGEVQHHLIDVRTGRPATSPWHEVTVCGARCVDADVAAKAAFLLGDAGPAWLEERGMPGRFVGRSRVVETVDWRAACT